MDGRSRWPIVLNPLPLESFTSWLDRHRSIYGVSAADLLRSIWPRGRRFKLDEVTHAVMLGGHIRIHESEITLGEWFRLLRRLLHEVEVPELHLVDARTFHPVYAALIRASLVGQPKRFIVGNCFEEASLSRQFDLLKMALSSGKASTNKIMGPIVRLDTNRCWSY